MTSQLRELEQQERIVYPQVPPKVKYLMTDHGESLQSLIETMYEWGTSHLKHMENKEKNTPSMKNDNEMNKSREV